MRGSLLFLLIFAASAKPLARCPRPIHLACVSILQCPVITRTTTLSVPVWSLSRRIVRPSSSLGQNLRAVLPVSEAAYLSLTESTTALSIMRLQVQGCPDSRIHWRVQWSCPAWQIHQLCSYPEYHCAPVPIRYG